MQWEELTAPKFKKAVEETKTCIFVPGILEKHGEHLPLGTDYMFEHKIACMSAEKEPAVVFPPFYFGQINEAKCFPGTVALKPLLVIEVIQDVLDEIGRNGFKKIIVFNAHGGNNSLMKYIAQCSLYEEKPYDLYFYTQRETDEMYKKEIQICGRNPHGHAGMFETSIDMFLFPELVDEADLPKTSADPLNRMKDIPYTFSGLSWYSNFPEHYAGDARGSTTEIGRQIVELHTDCLAQYIGIVKKDVVIPKLNREFFKRVNEI